MGLWDKIRTWVTETANPFGSGGEDLSPPPPPVPRPDVTSIFDAATTEAGLIVDPLIEQLQGIDTDLPTFQEWMASNEYTQGDTSGIEGLIHGLSGDLAGLDPNSPEARAYAASMGGFDTWEDRQAFMDNLIGMMEAQEGAGMSPEDMALQEKAIRRNTAEMERRAERMIADSFSESGSMGRMFLQADESLGQIANLEIQQQAQLAADNRNLKFEQYLAATQQYAQQYEQGAMSSTQFVDARRLALGQAIQGYATEMDAIFRQNEQYLGEYRADSDALANSIALTFQAISIELGLAMAEYDIAVQIAAAGMSEWYTEQEMQAIEAEQGFNWDWVWKTLGAAASLIAAFGGVKLTGGIDINF